MKSRVEEYRQLISECKGFELKGKTLLYTSANGHMFSQLNKEGELGLRFSETIKKEYIETLGLTPFKSYGATMKGYITVSEDLWKNHKKLRIMLQQSYDYVNTLPAK